MDENQQREMIQWSLGAYASLHALAIFGGLPHEQRMSILKALDDAPDFFKPSAEKYALDNIGKAIREVL